jgi:hypothetical protein
MISAKAKPDVATVTGRRVAKPILSLDGSGCDTSAEARGRLLACNRCQATFNAETLEDTHPMT